MYVRKPFMISISLMKTKIFVFDANILDTSKTVNGLFFYEITYIYYNNNYYSTSTDLRITTSAVTFINTYDKAIIKPIYPYVKTF